MSRELNMTQHSSTSTMKLDIKLTQCLLAESGFKYQFDLLSAANYRQVVQLEV